MGVAGLGIAVAGMTATFLTNNNHLALMFLSLAYEGMTFQQPNICAVCQETGGQMAGTVTGFFQTAAQTGSFTSSVVFGYMVKTYSSYQAPLIPMALFLGLGALLWLNIDPSRKLFSEHEKEAAPIT